jgi:hypothetical protein
MLTNLYNFKNELDKQGIFLGFSGPLSQELLVEIGDALKNKMKLEETTSSSTITKVFSMLIEQAQNIIHYSAEKVQPEHSPATLSSGIIVVGYNHSHYYVLCGNRIDNDTIEPLREKLTNLQNMNKEELKRYYREQRKQNAPTNSKGAGLGFIELARKSIKPIEFHFQSIDEQFSFFSLKTYI